MLMLVAGNIYFTVLVVNVGSLFLLLMLVAGNIYFTVRLVVNVGCRFILHFVPPRVSPPFSLPPPKREVFFLLSLSSPPHPIYSKDLFFTGPTARLDVR